MIKCPNCNSESITIERRPNGYCTCIDCKHRWKNGVVEKETCKKQKTKQIYIKTEMTEMPKGCRWVESGGNTEPCICIEYCKANKIHILRNPFEPERAIECPLVEHIVDDNKKVGE